jgi:regulator of protease activity HflC (stomatin/prohibitin superfamily)
MRILKDEIGLKFKKGEFEKVLKSGNYILFPWEKVEIVSLNEKFKHSKPLEFFIQNESFAAESEVIEIKDGEIVLHFEDGVFKEVLKEGKTLFWKSFHTHKFIIIELSKFEINGEVDDIILSKPALKPFIIEVEVENNKKGILFVDDKLQKVLDSGKYRYWKGTKSVNIQKVDLRQQQLEINGQDILTKDKVGIRVNLFCQYKIVDIEKVALEINNFENQFYVLLQLILREYIGTMTLDEILSKKEEIGAFMLANIKEQSEKFGLEVMFAGIKDIILPGEIRDIMNQVLIAEKKAQANIITRREETASTRSLLNTAKLMEENEVLFRLKELEYIERISEKINKVSLSGGGQMLEQLKQLFIPSKE